MRALEGTHPKLIPDYLCWTNESPTTLSLGSEVPSAVALVFPTALDNLDFALLVLAAIQPCRYQAKRG